MAKKPLAPICDGNHEGKIVGVYSINKLRPHGAVAIHLPSAGRYVLVRKDEMPDKPRVGDKVCVTAFSGTLIVNLGGNTPELPAAKKAA